MKELQVRDIFQSEEKYKKELAENLHDHLGQALAMVRLTLKKIQGNAVFCGFDDDINYAVSLLDKCIRYSRNMVTELSPIILHQFGLKAALTQLIEIYQARHQLKIKLKYNCHDDFSENEKTSLYRSINELLVNIIKHAQASKISINFEIKDSNLKVTVSDNGKGIAPDQHYGFGLMSVNERISLIGGTFSFLPLTKGTSALISLPLGDPT